MEMASVPALDRFLITGSIVLSAKRGPIHGHSIGVPQIHEKELIS